MNVDSLPPLVPPLRFSLVEEGVYRGAYPSLINLRFLRRLGLRSMVSLLPEPPAPHLVEWCKAFGVTHHFERVVPFDKDEVTLSNERAAELLQLLVWPQRQPVYVHCLDGVGVTGLLIMCLRKLLRWAPPSVHAEYSRFARNGSDVPLPPPPHVIAFLSAWKPEHEFLPRHLPSEPPHWLAAALQLSTADERAASAPTGGPAGRTAATPAARQPLADERELVVAGGDSGGLDALGNSSAMDSLSIEGLGPSRHLALDALAIEGLTLPPTRSHRPIVAGSDEPDEALGARRLAHHRETASRWR